MISPEDCAVALQAFERMDDVEAFSLSIQMLCVLARRYGKVTGQPCRIDHVKLKAVLDAYDQSGLEHPYFSEEFGYLIDFVDAFYERLHQATLNQFNRLDAAKSMPEVSKRLAMLEKHWSYKRNFTTSVPVEKASSLTINSFKLIMPDSIGNVRLITSEGESDMVEAEIIERYGHLIPINENQRLSEGRPENG